MKKIIFLCLLNCVVFAYAETVPTVSYNPSRLGQYTELKVADKAAFLGGLNVTQQLTISDEITFGWEEKESSSKAYEMTSLVTDTDKMAMLDMPNAVFQGKDGSLISYLISGPSPNANHLTNVTISGGGEAAFTSLSKDSYINSSAGTVMHKGQSGQSFQTYANIFERDVEGVSLEIEGVPNDVQNQKQDLIGEDGVNDGLTESFHLAGGDIPYKQGGNGKQFDDAKNLAWCARCVCANDECTQRAKVYLLANENSSTCSPSANNNVNCD